MVNIFPLLLTYYESGGFIGFGLCYRTKGRDRPGNPRDRYPSLGRKTLLSTVPKRPVYHPSLRLSGHAENRMVKFFVNRLQRTLWANPPD